MCNCNNKRQQWSSQQKQNSVRNSAIGMCQVQWLGKGQQSIIGDVTGREYLFTEPQQIIWVDKADLYYIQPSDELRILG